MINNSCDDSKKDDEFDIPLDISDFIDICKIYSKMGDYQYFIDELAETKQVESVPVSVLPMMISFFEKLSQNPYFGDAATVSREFSNKLKKYLKQYNKTLN